MGMKSDLISYIDAGYPIIYINSFEETKVDDIILEAMGGREGLEWNGAHGFVDFRSKRTLITDKGLADTLKMLSADDELDRKFLVLKDAHLHFEDPKVVSTMKDIALKISRGLDTTIIIVSSITKIPKELEKFITLLDVEFPTQEEIRSQICRFAQDQGVPPITDKLLEEMSIALKGMTEFEIENILALAFTQDGNFTRQDLQLIFTQKKQVIIKSGILEMIQIKEKQDDIGGLEYLKKWLERKSRIYKSMNRAVEFGVDMPKGVLIAGLPGCGKSLCAKATAQLFEVPLLRLDMGKIMGKYVGESEENMRKAIALAEAISPCILWVDELEKAFAGVNGSGNEVTVRLFGTFLTWMQEKTHPVFVVATANDISKLPPELMRKGRFDELFYVELPNPEERRKIFEIHIRKRGKDSGSLNISEFVQKTHGYSGADIESAVKDAIEAAFIEGERSLNDSDVKNAIENMTSISEIMGETLSSMISSYKDMHLQPASAHN